MPEEKQEKDENKIKERNLLIVLINKHDRLLVNGEQMLVGKLREKTHEFIANARNAENLPEKKYEVM